MKTLTGKIIRFIVTFTATIMTLGIGITVFGQPMSRVMAAVDINDSNFPDANFRAVISGGDYDYNQDGVLDDEELGSIINIYCQGMGITSVQGVEYFYALQGLWCQDNAIEYLDVSSNKDLHGVWCSGNPLTSLDFSGNPQLEWVYCFDCNLTSLNVSNNPNMAFIECNTNPLTSLDVSHNPKLEHLTCGSCELTSLDLSNNPNLSHLDAFRNHFTSLDVSHNPKMKRLDIWDNPGLGSIDVSHNPGLQYYNCANNDAGSVDVSYNPELQKLICSYNHIQKLDLTHNPKLVYLDCACNQIGSIDLSKNTELYFLQAFTNSFSQLNISNNPCLVKTYKEGKKKSEAAVCNGHSWTIDYGGDTSTGGDNIYFLCFDDSVKLITESDSNKEEMKQSDTADVDADPDKILTREMVIATLYAIEGSPSVGDSKSRFTDVKSGEWYEDALIWGEQNSIAVGSPNVASDTFGVGQWVTRQDLCLMLMRYSELKDYKRAIDFGRTDDYIDYYDIDYYAWEAVCWAVTWHIMEGKGPAGSDKSEQRIDPHGKASREEFESMYRKMMETNGLGSKSLSIVTPDKEVASNDTSSDNGNGEVSDNETNKETVTDSALTESEQSVTVNGIDEEESQIVLDLEELDEKRANHNTPIIFAIVFGVILLLVAAVAIFLLIKSGKKK